MSQVGEQSFNIARTAWLSQGLPLEVAATTIDSQCGSSQQATSLAAGMIGAGIEDVVLACGVEMMTRVPLGSNMAGGVAAAEELPVALRASRRSSRAREMIAKEYGITREDTDRFGLRSQQLAIQAWAGGPLHARGGSRRGAGARRGGQADGRDAAPSAATRACARRRSRSSRQLKAVEPGGVHTAGTSSQVSDGAVGGAAGVAASARRRSA